MKFYSRNLITNEAKIMKSRIIRINEVINKVGLKKSSIYKLISLNLFPKQIKLGIRASGWHEFEIDEWIKSRTQI